LKYRTSEPPQLSDWSERPKLLVWNFDLLNISMTTTGRHW